MPVWLLGPLVKYVGGLLVILTLCLALIGYGEQRKQREWDAAIASQAIAAMQIVVREAENANRIEVEHAAVVREIETRARRNTKEIIKYVQSPAEKCIESRDFVHLFDDIGRVSDSPAADSVPAPANSPGTPLELEEDRISSVEVLQAYNVAITKHRELEALYFALVDFERSSRKIALEGAGYSAE